MITKVSACATAGVRTGQVGIVQNARSNNRLWIGARHRQILQARCMCFPVIMSGVE